MDIVSLVTAISSCIAAVFSAIAVMVAVGQFRKTLQENERFRKEDWLRGLRSNASLVDARIAVKSSPDSNEHVIVIENHSQTSIRDVEITCRWNSPDYNKLNERPPKLLVLPRGSWVISRAYDSGYPWKFPTQVSSEILNQHYEPRFSRDENHSLISFTFLDGFGKRWKRDCLTGDVTECSEDMV